MPKSSPSKETATDSKTAISAASRPRPLPKTDDLPNQQGVNFQPSKRGQNSAVVDTVTWCSANSPTTRRSTSAIATTGGSAIRLLRQLGVLLSVRAPGHSCREGGA